MQKNTNLYHNLGYWFLSFIVLVVAGFYTSYFSVIFQPTPIIIHIHFALMMLWVVMLITQPFLIKYNKRALHRLIGKISYVLVPLVLIFSYLMLRMGYYSYFEELHQDAAKGLNKFTDTEILIKSADFPIALFYLIWLALFYSLAILNKRNSAIHARYMLAASLTLLGPTVDRALAINFHVENIWFIPVYAVSFFMADMVLAILLIKDYRNKKPVKTLSICLLIYITGQALYFILPKLSWWPYFMEFIMKPAP
ncbi:MAG TPA: hypothetical protein VIY47_16050 [Ignavibacteriaceae bacterium]